jgi:preprotein translocase subunit SecG
MENLLIFFYILISVVLILMILLQQGKGSDLGSAFGSGSSNTMFGPSTAANPLTKITAFLSAAFLILSMTITWQARNVNQEVILQEQSKDVVEEGILPDSTPKE